MATPAATIRSGGPHQIDIVAGSSPFAGGAAYFTLADVETPVPEPTSVALLGLGLVGLRRLRRR